MYRIHELYPEYRREYILSRLLLEVCSIQTIYLLLVLTLSEVENLKSIPRLLLFRFFEYFMSTYVYLYITYYFEFWIYLIIFLLVHFRQVFKVDQSRCHVLSVTIIRGRGITRGRLKDWCKCFKFRLYIHIWLAVE